jgi:hypothetical protein
VNVLALSAGFEVLIEIESFQMSSSWIKAIVPRLTTAMWKRSAASAPA